YFSLQIKHRAAADGDAVAVERAGERADAARQLPCLQLALAEARGPIRHQRTVRGAGRRIFVDALARREEARDEIGAILARRGGDRGPAIEPAERRKIRLQR